MSAPVHKSADFVFHQEVPPNGGPPLNRLIEEFVTPESNFFLRTHGDIPNLDHSVYRLTVSGRLSKTYQFSLKDLSEHFSQKEITATLQCAGNRRCSAAAIKAVPNEVHWGNDAISNAVWTGCSLTDVLHFVGLDAQAKHVEFVGSDLCQKEGTETRFGGSIPLGRALVGDVLLAWGMNGRALTREHVAPLRAIVPGYIGARSVKWLQEINLRNTASTNLFHAHAYRLFPPGVSSASARLGTRFRARGTFCQLLHLFDRGTIERTSRQRLRDRRRESSRCPGRCRISRTLAVERGILPRPQKLACGVDGRPSFPSFSSGNSSACGLGIQPRTRNPKIRKASGTSKDT
jgi:DMSO/TMAO reductase YedYZ molybdopterin-dependent catalytic subunit